MGQRLNIIIVAEGAIDQQGEVITAEGVKKVRTEYGLMDRVEKDEQSEWQDTKMGKEVVMEGF